MKVMALDYAPQNIRVNAVIPGFIDTPMNANVMKDPTIARDVDRRPFPSGVWEPWRDAAVILFLASDDASYVVGSAFVVDGGQLA